MLSSNDFMNAYQKLYAAMRCYIWGVDIIEMLANLEVSVYNAFVDVSEVDKWFSKLERAVNYIGTMDDDDELKLCFDNFRKLIDDCDNQYHLLYRVNEVVQEEDLHGN